jgi:hypothetical protein
MKKIIASSIIELSFMLLPVTLAGRVAPPPSPP